jgi:hypothetical protein
MQDTTLKESQLAGVLIQRMRRDSKDRFHCDVPLPFEHHHNAKVSNSSEGGFHRTSTPGENLQKAHFLLSARLNGIREHFHVIRSFFTYFLVTTFLRLT